MCELQENNLIVSWVKVQNAKESIYIYIHTMKNNIHTYYIHLHILPTNSLYISTYTYIQNIVRTLSYIYSLNVRQIDRQTHTSNQLAI